MARRKDRIYMPMGVGGLLRYPEEGEEAFKIEPKHVLLFSLLLVLIEIILRLL